MIRIKLAILESDKNYLEKIMTVFNSTFHDKLEVFSFTDKDTALNVLASSRIDVFIASEDFHIETDQLPGRCAFAYFTESNGLDTLYDQRTICKFQKAELIYKEILSIFSEKSGGIIGYKKDGLGEVSILTFLSSSGGTGSSTAAAACAMHLSKQGKKVLYLNIEQFGCANLFFNAEGQYHLGDVLFAIKSKKSNLILKLEGTVKQDISGVYFYESCKLPLDVYEIKEEDITKLLDELEIAGTYDYIVVDMNLSFHPVSLAIMKRSKGLVFVTDGTYIAGAKNERVFQSLEILDNQNDWMLMKKAHILYNKTNHTPDKQLNPREVSTLGIVPYYQGTDHKQIAKLISSMNLFEQLM